jgi:hypothetical protein
MSISSVYVMRSTVRDRVFGLSSLHGTLPGRERPIRATSTAVASICPCPSGSRSVNGPYKKLATAWIAIDVWRVEDDLLLAFSR